MKIYVSYYFFKLNALKIYYYANISAHLKLFKFENWKYKQSSKTKFIKSSLEAYDFKILYRVKVYLIMKCKLCKMTKYNVN